MKDIPKTLILATVAFAVVAVLYYESVENAFAATGDNGSSSMNTTTTCASGAKCSVESQLSQSGHNIDANGIHLSK